MPEIIGRVEAVGGRVELLSEMGYCYRMTGARGAVIDYWATTGRWIKVRSAGSARRGLDEMLHTLQEDGIEDAAPDLVTIFTDASHCSETKVGGWAAWIKNGHAAGEIFSGALRGRIETTDVSEAMGIANALYTARNRGVLRAGISVMVQCDCAPVLARLHAYVPGSKTSAAPGGMTINKAPFGGRSTTRRKRHNGAAQWDAILRQINTLVASEQINLILRHVKGHSGKVDGRSMVNAMCDRAAKSAMRARRDEIRKGGST